MKHIKTIVTTLIAAVMLTLVSGCNLTDGQIKMIARSSGMATAITWIAVDNPDAEAKNAVSKALSTIQTNVAVVDLEETGYVDVVYPIVEIYVRDAEDIPAQYKPLALAGSLAVLDGLDMLFAMNPEWNEKEDLAIGVVSSFVSGAQVGLALANDDPRIVKARKTAAIRARIYKK